MNRRPYLAVAMILMISAFIFGIDSCALPLGATDWKPAGHGLISSETPTKLLDDLYDRRLDRLADDRRVMINNLQWQAVLVVFTFAVFWHYDRQYTQGATQSTTDQPDTPLPPIELFGIKIPRAMLPWIKIILPVVVLYVWHQFGYLLIGLIENRRVLAEIIALRESGIIAPEGVLSARRLLGDGFFILDPWFGTFESGSLADVRPDTDLFVPSWIKVIAYSVFLGIVHATVLLPLCAFIRELDGNPWRKLVTYFYLAILLCLLLATHFEFRFAFQNPNWGQPIILTTAAVLCLVGFKIQPMSADKHNRPPDEFDPSGA